MDLCVCVWRGGVTTPILNLRISRKWFINLTHRLLHSSNHWIKDGVSHAGLEAVKTRVALDLSIF